MEQDEHKPMFAKVGRSVAVEGSAGSRALLWFIAAGMLVAFLSLVWELRLGAQREARPVEVTEMATEAAEAEAEIDARIAAGEEPWSAPPDAE